MKKTDFLIQKDNITLITLSSLIILSFIMMHLWYSQNDLSNQNNNTESITTSKTKVGSDSEHTTIPPFLPAL